MLTDVPSLANANTYYYRESRNAASTAPQKCATRETLSRNNKKSMNADNTGCRAHNEMNGSECARRLRPGRRETTKKRNKKSQKKNADESVDTKKVTRTACAFRTRRRTQTRQKTTFFFVSFTSQTAHFLTIGTGEPRCLRCCKRESSSRAFFFLFFLHAHRSIRWS